MALDDHELADMLEAIEDTIRMPLENFYEVIGDADLTDEDDELEHHDVLVEQLEEGDAAKIENALRKFLVKLEKSITSTKDALEKIDIAIVEEEEDPDVDDDAETI